MKTSSFLRTLSRLFCSFCFFCQCHHRDNRFNPHSYRQPEMVFTLSVAGKSAPLFVSDKDYLGVIRACKDLQTDIGKVTNAIPELFTTRYPRSKAIVIAGTLVSLPLLTNWSAKENINQKYCRKMGNLRDSGCKKPLPGVREALVITGSDKRGTIYGIYELSSGIGVSPWYWWADVPVEHRESSVHRM